MRRGSPSVLREDEVRQDIGLLDRAWAGAPTFAFVAEKADVPSTWVERTLGCLPPEFQTRHFALLTSGSTGRPKLVVGSRERAEGMAALLHGLQESEPVEETVLALPLSYCYSFVNQWLWAKIHARRVVQTLGLSRPDTLGQALSGARQAMLCLVGAQVPMLARYFEGASFPGIIRLHFAGGRFPQERLEALRELFPAARIFNNYGCAEAMPRLTLRPADAAQAAEHIGWCLPGVEMRSSPAGEMLFRSPHGAVAQADDDGCRTIAPADWVPTGDLGRQKPDGHWEVLGRCGEVFKRYGEKVSIPALLKVVHQGLDGQAAAYRERDAAGEDGYVLVLSPAPKDSEVKAILKRLSADHPRAHWPLRIESLAVLPYLPNGKVDAERLKACSGLSIHWRQRI